MLEFEAKTKFSTSKYFFSWLTISVKCIRQLQQKRPDVKSSFLQIRKKNFADAIKVVRSNPGVKFVIDHLAKPDVKSGETRDWFDGMEKLAGFPNVQCKLSGMVTEADPQNWKPNHFLQYVGHVVRKFGSNRIMFGSDWPVCRMANTDFEGVYNLLDKLLEQLDFEEKRKVFETNAINFYNLKV